MFQNAAEMTPFGKKVSLFHSEKSWKTFLNCPDSKDQVDT